MFSYTHTFVTKYLTLIEYSLNLLDRSPINRNVQLKSASVPPQPASLASVFSKSDPFSSSTKATTGATSGITGPSSKKKKTSLFAGLVKRNEPSTGPSASISTSTETDNSGSKLTAKRKTDDHAAESKKPKVEPAKENTATAVSPSSAAAASTKPKPNALLSLAAYDSSSDEDE